MPLSSATVFTLLALLAWPVSATWTQVPGGVSWNLQYTGTLANMTTKVIDIDLFDTSNTTIQKWRKQGHTVICYFSAGSSENWRPDFSQFPKAVLGKPLDGWPGEQWLDVRSPALKPAMLARMKLAVQKGCNGVDPDNMDGYTQKSGFNITASDQLAYNRWIADTAHSLNLAVGLKNDLGQAGALEPSFDFAVNEQCYYFGECDLLKPFAKAGKAVLQVEYTVKGSGTFAKMCANAKAANRSMILKKLDLGSYVRYC